MRRESIPVPARSTLAWWMAAAVTAASVVLVCVVLPAEFNRDPTGFGRLTGLSRLAAAPRTVPAASGPTGAAPRTGPAMARFEAQGFRHDVIDIPLRAAEDGEGAELEYKVAMPPGAVLVYSWSVTGLSAADQFYYDFHSESNEQPTPRVEEYRQATGLSSNGSLVAPFAGIHGWYFQNQSARAVIVHLQLSGFYELVPAGAPGNLNGILPRAGGQP